MPSNSITKQTKRYACITASRRCPIGFLLPCCPHQTLQVKLLMPFKGSADSLACVHVWQFKRDQIEKLVDDKGPDIESLLVGVFVRVGTVKNNCHMAQIIGSSPDRGCDMGIRVRVAFDGHLAFHKSAWIELGLICNSWITPCEFKCWKADSSSDSSFCCPRQVCLKPHCIVFHPELFVREVFPEGSVPVINLRLPSPILGPGVDAK